MYDNHGGIRVFTLEILPNIEKYMALCILTQECMGLEISKGGVPGGVYSRVSWVIFPPLSIYYSIGPKYTSRFHGIPLSIALTEKQNRRNQMPH